MLEWGKVITGDKDRQTGSAMEDTSSLDKQPIPEITGEITGDFFGKADASNGTLHEDMPITTTTMEFSGNRKKTRRPMPILRHHLKFKSNGTTTNLTERPTTAMREAMENARTMTSPRQMKAIEKTANSTSPDEKAVETDHLKEFAQFVSLYRTIDGWTEGGVVKQTFERLGKAALFSRQTAVESQGITIQQ